MAFDRLVFELIHAAYRRNALLDVLGIFFAEYLPYFILVGFSLYLVIREQGTQRVYGFFLAAFALVLSRGIVVEIIRFFYHRPRPFVALSFEPLITPIDSFSFPSGHAAAFSALATVFFFFHRRFGGSTFILVVLMAIARVFVGVHWPSDVILGALIGIGSAGIARWILPRPSPGTRGAS